MLHLFTYLPLEKNKYEKYKIGFLIEMEGDFTFIGNQYHLAENRDLYIDLLFFRRRLDNWNMWKGGGKKMLIDEIASAVLKIISKYSIKKVTLFGSRADGTNYDDSDIDLIMEFNKPVSLITLSMVQIDLEDMLGVKVDVIHGPVMPGDMIEIRKDVVLYAA